MATVFPMKCSFNKQQFYLLHRSLHITYASLLTLNLRNRVYSWTPSIWDALVIHCIVIPVDVSGKQMNSTQYSNVVPHFSTNWTWRCLTSWADGKWCCHLGMFVLVRIRSFRRYDSSCYTHMPFLSSKEVHYRYVLAVILPLKSSLCYRLKYRH